MTEPVHCIVVYYKVVGVGVSREPLSPVQRSEDQCSSLIKNYHW